MIDILWPDAQIDSLSVDYDKARLVVAESTGAQVVIEAHGVLGLELPGVWDEVVVASGAVVEEDVFAARCWDSVRARFAGDPPDSGSPDRNARSFKTLVIALADGCVLRLVAARFTTTRHPPG